MSLALFHELARCWCTLLCVYALAISCEHCLLSHHMSALHHALANHTFSWLCLDALQFHMIALVLLHSPLHLYSCHVLLSSHVVFMLHVSSHCASNRHTLAHGIAWCMLHVM